MKTGRAAVLALAALAAGLPGRAPARPHRIASLNLCTDDLVVALADRADIVSLSPMARDPGISLVAPVAASLPDNQASAEEILRERPDLVLAETGAAGETVALLRRLGLRVETVGTVERLDQVAPMLRRIAGWLGRQQRGEALLRRMAETLAAIPRPATPPSALIYDSNGWSAGPGTLKDDVLRAAGFVNQATRLGLEGYGPLALETVIADPPDLLITERYRAGDVSLAERWLDHPALRELPVRHAELPSRLLICGTPALADAAALLARWRAPAIPPDHLASSR